MHFNLDNRRGQANAISLMILVAATLTVALALYGYFTGMYAHQGEKQSLYDVYSMYSNNIDIYVEVYTSGNSSGVHQYCTMISVRSNVGDPIRLYLTLLPVGTGTSGLSVDNSIVVTPVDYTGVAPVRELYVWLAEDLDGDGIVELLNTSNTIEFENIMSCTDLYNYYTRGMLHGLPLPSDVDVRDIGFYASNITVFLEGPSLLESARADVGGVPSDLAVPLWNITLQPFEKKSVYFFMASPVDPGQLSVVGAFKNPVNSKYVIFSVQSIKK